MCLKVKKSSNVLSKIVGAEIPCPVHWPRASSWTFQKYNLSQMKIPIISSSAIGKSLFLYFYKIGVTYPIFDILKEANWMLFQASADNFCYVSTILLYVSWKYRYWCIQKELCDVVQPLNMYQKFSLFSWSLLVKLLRGS